MLLSTLCVSSYIIVVAKRGAIFNADNNLDVFIGNELSVMDTGVYFCGGSYGFQQSFGESVTVNVRGKP